MGVARGTLAGGIRQALGTAVPGKEARTAERKLALPFRRRPRRTTLSATVAVLMLGLLAQLGTAGAVQASRYLYWDNEGTGTIARANVNGEEVNPSLIKGVSEPRQMTVDGAHVYWANGGSASLGRASLNGEEPNLSFIAGVTEPRGVAVDGKHIYWTSLTGGTIGRANLNGTEVNQSFITGAVEPNGLAVDGVHLYWTDQSRQTIGRANLEGKEVDQNFITAASEVRGVAVDGQHIYWDNLGGNTIGRANLEGKEVNQSFITGAGSPSAVAVDGAHIYWTNLSSNTIGRANLEGKEVNQSFIKGAIGPWGLAVTYYPAVITEPASSVTQTSASLNATVNPNGAAISECKLEYGTTNSYGSSEPCATLPGSGETPVAVSASVTGLSANTSYHFRISATNMGGTSYGSDETFKTLPNAPAVITEPASSVTQTSASLNATVNPNGTEVTKCEFEYGTTNSYGKIAPCSALPGSGETPVEVSASATSLVPNTTYHFRISATSTGGTSKSSDETFKTPPNPPTVVTGTAMAIHATNALLTGMVNPNGGEVSECKLEYGTTTSYGSSAACSPPPMGSGTNPIPVIGVATGLAARTTYHFRVSATNAGGTSKGSDETFKTPPIPPTVVTESGSAVTQTSASLNATVNPNGGEVSECKLEYGTTNSYGSSLPCTPAPGSGETPVEVSASATSLVPNTTYHFRISATNAGGTSKGSDETLKTPPNPPTVVTERASAVTQTSASLNATVNPNGGEVSECKLEYGTTNSYGSSLPCTPAPGSGKARSKCPHRLRALARTPPITSGSPRRTPAAQATARMARSRRNPPTPPASPTTKTRKSTSQNRTRWRSTRAGTSSSQTQAMSGSWSSTQNAST